MITKKFRVQIYTGKIDLTKPINQVRSLLISFGAGLKRHGILPKFMDGRKDGSEQIPCDMSVTWGIWKKNNIIKYHKDTGTPHLVMERGFTHPRCEWTMAGFNGLNRKANFCNENSPSDRWYKYFPDLIHPWQTGGEYALIIGQINGDQALYGFNLDSWIIKLQQYLDSISVPWKYRPHPGKDVVWNKDNLS